MIYVGMFIVKNGRFPSLEIGIHLNDGLIYLTDLCFFLSTDRQIMYNF